jgi:hypothetical protein
LDHERVCLIHVVASMREIKIEIRVSDEGN